MMKDESELNGRLLNAVTNDYLNPPATAKAELGSGEETNDSPRQSSTRTGKKKTLEALCSIRCHYNSMAHLKSVEEFYSPRKTDLDSADKILQITFSSCTPRLLVRPRLQTQAQVPSPNSGGEGGDKDITPAGSENMSDMTDVNLESSTETGWSVRDNPIAKGSSCKPDADSDEEDLVQKMSNETTSDVNQDKSSTTSSVEHNMDLDSEVEADEHNDRGKAMNINLRSEVIPPSNLFFLNDERLIKPYESEESDAESTKRSRKVLSRSSSYDPPEQPVTSSIVMDKCSCSGKEHEVKQLAELREDIAKGGLEGEVLFPPAYLLNVHVSGRIVDVISKSWRGVLSYSDLFLGGTLLIALSLPFAVMISKLLVSSSPEQFIFVPT